MRYKGENNIEFSTDKENNVTVILGDNTVGKTTLAQAFRWCLYGTVANTQYERKNSVTLLNFDVLSEMSANDREEVMVELDLLNDNENSENKGEYRIIRRATFIREFPKMSTKRIASQLRVIVPNTETGQSLTYSTDGSQVEDLTDAGKIIRQLLPNNLAPYFLFDGERWNDETETRGHIKDSIYSIVGINSLVLLQDHIGGRNGAYAVLENMKTGSSQDYDMYKRKIDEQYKIIEREEKDIEEQTANEKAALSKAEEIQNNLNNNRTVEEEQNRVLKLQNDNKVLNESMKGYYRDIVRLFSSSYKYYASPLLEKALDFLSDVNLDGSDIPGVIDKTIDYILSHHKCICGRDVDDNSEAARILKELKDVVPPALIGRDVGRFQDKLKMWSSDSGESFKEIKEKADEYQDDKDKVEENEAEILRINKRIDRKIDFGDERKKLRMYQNKAMDARTQIKIAEKSIETAKSNIKSYESKMEQLEIQNERNKKIRLEQRYCNLIKETAKKIYEDRTNKLFTELNHIIEDNFREMFNEQDKVARLDNDFTLKLYYKRKAEGYSALVEAKTLSEGEKIARNFSFIVSILEYANEQRELHKDEEVSSLPLVLDGPFSKLSDVNTSKIAAVIPQIAEQVIIFMLDKDWKASGLEKATDSKYKYRIIKNIDENSSIIKPEAQL